MDSSSATNRMRHFVDGLDQSASLEEAVDVADSYSSIYQTKLRELLLIQVQINQLRTESLHDLRGATIYQLLNAIFLSMDTTNHIDISSSLAFYRSTE